MNRSSRYLPSQLRRGQRLSSTAVEPAVHAFATQYTGLILIVCTVIISSLTVGRLDQPDDAPKKNKPTPLSTITLEGLFEEGSANPNIDKLSAIRELLLQHDIQGQLILPLNQESRSLSIQRLISLRKHSQRLGLPAAYLSVVLDERQVEPPTLIIEPAP